MKRLLVLGLLFTLAFFASACAAAPLLPPTPTRLLAATRAPTSAAVVDDWGTVTVKKGDTIKIAFTAALTGAVAVFGLDEQIGAKMAVEDLGKGAIQGFNIELISKDDQCSDAGGMTVANQIVADPQIVGVVGLMCTSGEIPATDILDQHHIVSLTPSATAVDVTARKLETVNQVVYNDLVQAPADAAFVLNQLTLTKVAVIHDSELYGQSLAEEFRNAFTKGGGTVTDFEAVTQGAQDFRTILTKIAVNKPQLIFFGGFIPEGAALVAQKNEVGLGDTIFMGADGIFSPKYIQVAAGKAEGSYASFANLTKSAKYDEFVKKYQAKGGKQENIVYSPQAYDAVGVMIQALKSVAKLDSGGNLVLGRHALARAARTTSGYAGYSGDITFDANGNLAHPSAQVVVHKVVNGKFAQFFPPLTGTPTASSSPTP
jgi:branched-chain amino acid transport system substrate-binding protein